MRQQQLVGMSLLLFPFHSTFAVHYHSSLPFLHAHQLFLLRQIVIFVYRLGHQSN